MEYNKDLTTDDVSNIFKFCDDDTLIICKSINILTEYATKEINFRKSNDKRLFYCNKKLRKLLLYGSKHIFMIRYYEYEIKNLLITMFPNCSFIFDENIHNENIFNENIIKGIINRNFDYVKNNFYINADSFINKLFRFQIFSVYKNITMYELYQGNGDEL